MELHDLGDTLSAQQSKHHGTTLSAQQSKRVLADSDWGNMHLVNYLDEVAVQRDVCRSLDNAPRVRIARFSSVSAFGEKLQVDLSFSDDLIAVRAMNVPPIIPCLCPFVRRTPEMCGMFFEVRGLGSSIRLSVSGFMKAGSGGMRRRRIFVLSRE